MPAQPGSSSSSRPAPYPKHLAHHPARHSSTSRLLATLNDPRNPITHSDLYERTDHIVASGRGHQVKDAGIDARKSHWAPFLDAKRREAVPEADASAKTAVFRFLKVFIADTADVESRQLIQDGGGRVLNYAAGATHIVSVFPWKSPAKVAKQSRTRAVVQHVVKPAWVKESVAQGRRKPERAYSV